MQNYLLCKLTKVFNAYKRFDLKPDVYTSLSLFKITLPNINYDAFKQDNSYGEINDTIKLVDLKDMRIYDLVKIIQRSKRKKL